MINHRDTEELSVSLCLCGLFRFAESALRLALLQPSVSLCNYSVSIPHSGTSAEDLGILALKLFF
jgi:hypothetical protein